MTMSNKTGNLIIRNVFLAHDYGLRESRYDLVCIDGMVVDVMDAEEDPGSHLQHLRTTLPLTDQLIELDLKGKGILLPAAVCVMRIYILTSASYLENVIRSLQDFAEALLVTAKQKSEFINNTDDLYVRGTRLIIESVESGVTMMRAHVEIDTTVLMVCLNVGIRLKEEFQEICDVQLAAFAQDPLFLEKNDKDPGENYHLLSLACATPGVEVVGSAPYVESTTEHAKENITLIFELAFKHSLHIDFHLDYNLSPSSEPLIWDVLHELRTRVRGGRWPAGKHVCIGHATRLTLFTPDEWKHFKQIVDEDALPITLVGLPQSDIYMMGREAQGYRSPPRCTLNIPKLRKEHQIQVAMAVNNVQNPFTPQGTVDPLGLCPLGVALFQTCLQSDCQSMMEAVTTTARLAISGNSTTTGSSPESMSNSSHLVIPPRPLLPQKGDQADFVILHENNFLQSAVCNPSFERTTIRKGTIVAKRSAKSWHLPPRSLNHK